MNFQNSPPFERSACFYETTTENFECFQCFNFETNFLKKPKPFSKNWNTGFQLELACQKPLLRQIEWVVHDETIAEDGVLPVTTLFFENFVSV